MKRHAQATISSPGDVRPEWITEVLREGGILDQGRAVAVRVALARKLHVSRVARLEVEYSSDASASAPRKLFLKLSLPERPAAGQPDLQDQEVQFYRTVIGRMEAAQTVRCYHASFSSETGDSVILLEDLSDTHFQSPNGTAPSENDSRLAIEGLAKFHANWWDDPRLGHGIGKIFDQAWLERFLADLEKSVTSFVAFLGDDLSRSRRRVYKKMLAASRNIWGRLTVASGLTVTHGDMHWWNFLFPNDPSAEQTRIFDWQLWHIDLGARDLAFLIGLGGFAERRPELEGQFLRLYYETLIAAGVSNYPWNRFWEDYRLSAIRNLNIPVIFWTQGKHRHTWTTAMARAFEAFDQLKCEELL